MRKLTQDSGHTLAVMYRYRYGVAVWPRPRFTKNRTAHALGSCLRPRPEAAHWSALGFCMFARIRKLVRLAEELTTRSARISAASAVTPAVAVPPPWGAGAPHRTVSLPYLSRVPAGNGRARLARYAVPDLPSGYLRPSPNRP